jgi:hypothetical protein
LAKHATDFNPWGYSGSFRGPTLTKRQNRRRDVLDISFPQEWSILSETTNQNRHSSAKQISGTFSQEKRLAGLICIRSPLGYLYRALKSRDRMRFVRLESYAIRPAKIICDGSGSRRGSVSFAGSGSACRDATNLQKQDFSRDSVLSRVGGYGSAGRARQTCRCYRGYPYEGSHIRFP